MSDIFWNDVYLAKSADERSWTQEWPFDVEVIERLVPEHDAAIIDVGAGASDLLVALVARGFTDLTALDISAVALDEARRRVGPLAPVTWIVSDVTTFDAERSYALWRDRATFHFLTEPPQQRRYLNVIRRAIQPDGYFLLATFAPDGPSTCSGLPVQRWSTQEMVDFVDDDFHLVHEQPLLHVTPWGSEQSFNSWVFQRRP
ncbi:MAG: class I SAM-dependent methyltransferase [Acidobacteriota bacterium]|nr:class I SAM-dependent methyltransferase [Acidobacteriota bacterium]MDE3044141.1 class I SAM-dependent methyltransferase [Acidobacteriota bacterium]